MIIVTIWSKIIQKKLWLNQENNLPFIYNNSHPRRTSNQPCLISLTLVNSFRSRERLLPIEYFNSPGTQ